ncbi:hypothetical protein MJO28_000805 [Puccinia striiformis f. sp. tritici]|uniref:Dolichyl-diphosphooligosaccharide-protein glycosyltransferase subunit OST5 n=3 Tax=Puccinia striiformis TaxID=27350 RepID=A0A2S4VIJ4_9BASI|nr:hypothetical protein MJO28_000805 [Puccinia striiformis f. sp. tritici]POW09305.1 hypothetical protein PSTT_06882 [Puccinia striiformis]
MAKKRKQAAGIDNKNKIDMDDYTAVSVSNSTLPITTECDPTTHQNTIRSAHQFTFDHHLTSKITQMAWDDGTGFAPDLPTHLHSSIGFALLASAFGLGFLFTTLPKTGFPTTELIPALMASLLTGFGVVFLFNAAGVYV